VRDLLAGRPGAAEYPRQFDAINRGIIVERIFIVARERWLGGLLLPNENVLPWILDHHNHGVRVMLCLEDDIQSEPDQLIYCNHLHLRREAVLPCPLRRPLYVDTARLGRILPAALAIQMDYPRFSARYGGSSAFQGLLLRGGDDWSAKLSRQYPCWGESSLKSRCEKESSAMRMNGRLSPR
jgi:hypothetical protein